MSSGFISEAEVAEIRLKRQEEWEKVRKPEDPLERPEEPIDNRSLFDRLQEQKQKKDLEYEEAHKLKNMIKGLDDDEIEFLDLVDRTKLAADRKKNLEEEQELNDYRNRVATLQEKAMENKIQNEISKNKPNKNSNGNRSSQHKLLKGAVVTKKRKLSEEEGHVEEGDASSVKIKKEGDDPVTNEAGDVKDAKNVTGDEITEETMKCIAILPGLGNYSESSSEYSSDSEAEVIQISSHLDILGRKLVKKDKES